VGWEGGRRFKIDSTIPVAEEMKPKRFIKESGRQYRSPNGRSEFPETMTVINLWEERSGDRGQRGKREKGERKG
jgi:hypothetical protein